MLAWNHLSDTLECLESLKHVNYPDCCIVLVDNGSSDATVATVREKHPVVHIIENRRNLGYAEGNNVGIRYALGHGADYVLVLNNDTIVDPALLQFLTSEALAHPKIGVISPRIYWHSNPNVIWFDGARWNPETAQFATPRSGERDNGLKTQSETDYASGCALFFRADVAAKVGLFDARFFLTWEEADWCYRVRRQGYRVVVQPNAKVWHKVSRSFEAEYAGAEIRYYYSRNRWLWIERNLTGHERRQAFQRCLRETYWSLLSLLHRDLTPDEKAVVRAQLLGSFHYVMRRFGERPALNS